MVRNSVKISVVMSIVSCLMVARSLAAETISIQSHQNIVPLVELYTSEGCSSCPPADAALSTLGQNLGEDLRAIPIGFHVDYWDYLGWPDVHAKKAYTQRQRAKGKANKQRSIYTPEFLVGGIEMRGGAGRLIDAIEAHNKVPATVNLKADIQKTTDQQLKVSVEVDNQSDQVAQLQAVIFENQIERKIEGGENSGVLMTYDYVAREHSEAVIVPKGQSKHALEIDLPSDADPENLGVAIFAEAKQNLLTLQAMQTPIANLFKQADAQ